MTKQELIDTGHHQLTENYHLDDEADMLFAAIAQAGKNGEKYELLWDGNASVSIWTKPKHIIEPEQE